MSLPARRELLASTAPRYAKANKKLKQTILDEFTASTGYHRKYAIDLLKHYDPKTTKTKRHPLRTARLGVMIGLLLALSGVNMWAPPPDNMTVVGVSAIVMYLGIAWLASWVDRDPPPDPDSETHHRKRKPKAAR